MPPAPQLHERRRERQDGAAPYISPPTHVHIKLQLEGSDVIRDVLVSRQDTLGNLCQVVRDAFDLPAERTRYGILKYKLLCAINDREGIPLSDKTEVGDLVEDYSWQQGSRNPPFLRLRVQLPPSESDEWSRMYQQVRPVVRELYLLACSLLSFSALWFKRT